MFLDMVDVKKFLARVFEETMDTFRFKDEVL